MRTKKSLLDSVHFQKEKKEPIFHLDAFLSFLENRHSTRSASLFFAGERSSNFFTEDSKLYITPREQELINRGIKLERRIKKWDSLSSRIAGDYLKCRCVGRRPEKDFLLNKLSQRQQKIFQSLSEKKRAFRNQWSPVELWNFSLIGAILFGMISMTFIYRIMGPGVFAGNSPEIETERNYENQTEISLDDSHVLAVATKLEEPEDKRITDFEEGADYIESIVIDMEIRKKEEFEEEMRQMVRRYPIEKMLPYIAEKDRIVAAFLISIAKKESNWGKRVPVLDGQDCFNYWGYRGIRKRMGTGGHTCFDSPQDAVNTVSKRLETLIKSHKLNTPSKLVIWKCGSACHKDNPEAVRKWISDVELYFQKLNK